MKRERIERMYPAGRTRLIAQLREAHPRLFDVFECPKCGANEIEEVSGAYKCAACGYQEPECTCYEVTGGHMPGCAFNRSEKGLL